MTDEILSHWLAEAEREAALEGTGPYTPGGRIKKQAQRVVRLIEALRAEREEVYWKI